MKKKASKSYTILDEMMASPTEPLPLHEQHYQLIRMYQGLTAIENNSSPTINDWKVVSDAVNLMETMVIDMGICEDQDGLLNDAMQALVKAADRRASHGVIRLDGDGLKAIRWVLRDYADAISFFSARTMISCHRRTEKRVQEILQGKKKQHDVKIKQHFAKKTLQM